MVFSDPNGGITYLASGTFPLPLNHRNVMKDELGTSSQPGPCHITNFQERKGSNDAIDATENARQASRGTEATADNL